MKTTYVSQEQIALATAMRADHKTWSEISKATGILEDTIRRRVDTRWRDKRNAQVREAALRRRGEESAHRGHLSVRHMHPAEERAALATVPVDTRTRLARWFGDPIPGRSALDARQAKRSVSPVINTTHTVPGEHAVNIALGH